MDALTKQIIQQVEALPARKKAAVLELLKAAVPAHPAGDEERERGAWKNSLSELSTWSSEELEDLYEARAWLNRWTPKSW